MWFDATNLTWVNPSPNMRSLTEAALYPGIGFAGKRPIFQWVAARTRLLKWSALLARRSKTGELSQRAQHSWRAFRARALHTKLVDFQNEECGGVNIIITDRSRFRSVLTGIEIAVGLHRLFPAEWKNRRLLPPACSFRYA